MAHRTLHLRALSLVTLTLALARSSMARDTIPTVVNKQLALKAVQQTTRTCKLGPARAAAIGNGLMKMAVVDPNHHNVASDFGKTPICDWTVSTPGTYTVTLSNTDSKAVSFRMVFSSN